jgi:hypothetical protein
MGPILLRHVNAQPVGLDVRGTRLGLRTKERSGGRARTSNLMNQNHARCQLRHPRMGEASI